MAWAVVLLAIDLEHYKISSKKMVLIRGKNLSHSAHPVNAFIDAGGRVFEAASMN